MVLDCELIDAAGSELDIAMRYGVEVRSISTIDSFSCHTNNSSRRSILLQTATAAAAARVPVRLNVEVPELAGHAFHPAPNFTAQDDAASHARTQCVHSHVRCVAACTQPLLSHRGNIGVVLENHVGFEKTLDIIANRKVLPTGKVRGAGNDPGIAVDEARNANADARQLTLGAILC